MSSIDLNNTNKALFKNTGIIAIGQISTKIVNFLLLPLYTALLTTQEYGLVDILSTYSALIVVIVGFQINQAVFRFLVTNRKNKEKLIEICSTTFFCSVIICLIYSFAFLIIQYFIPLQCKWYLLLQVIATIFLQLISGITRGLGNNILYSFGNFISAFITIILNVFSIAVFHMGVEMMLIGYIAGPFFGGLIMLYFGKLYKYIKISFFSFSELKIIINYSLPLVPNELSWTLIHSSDRMIVSSILNVAMNGLIAVASKFSYIYTTVFSIFNTSWTEQVVLHYKDVGGKKYINNMFEKVVVFFGCLAIGIIACMPLIFKILVNEQYKTCYGLIPFYMIAVFFNATIGMISAIYLAENETKKVAMSTGVAAAINIIVDLVLIRWIGIYAAPISSICGYAFITVWRIIDVNRRHCKITMKIKKVVLLFMMLLLSLISYWSTNTIVNILFLFIVFIFAILLNKSIVKDLVLSIKKQ